MWNTLFTAVGTPSKPSYNGGQDNEITYNTKSSLCAINEALSLEYN